MKEFLASIPSEYLLMGMAAIVIAGIVTSVVNLVRVIRRSRRQVTVRIVVTEGELTIPLDPNWSKAERDKAISKAVDEYLEVRRAEKRPARSEVYFQRV